MSPPPPRRSRPRVRLAALLAAMLAIACGGDPEARSVVLITVDTLRADALGAYGAAPGETGPTTPALDRLAAEGVLFENAVAPMPLTRPSHFSIFTGRYPREHGVVNNQLTLPEEAHTLAETFRAAGFRTGGFPGVKLLQEKSGAHQGFDTFVPPEALEVPAAAVVERATAWLAEVGPEERYFLWVHVFDPHMPYAPPPEHVPQEAPERPSGVGDRASWNGLKALARRHGGALDEAAAERIRALYDGEVAAVDAALGDLLAAVAARPRGNETAVALTADHGECFDHGYFFRHSDCLYQGALHVPLIVRTPGGPAGLRVAPVAELVDLPATLLRAAGLEAPGSFRAGDLMADLRGDAGGASGRAFVQPILSDHQATGSRDRIWGGIESVAGVPLRPSLRSPVEPVAVRDGRWKYLLGGPLGEELYDLAVDPEERDNLAERERRRARELRAAARRFQREVPFTVLDAGALPPELREQLEALGYL